MCYDISFTVRIPELKDYFPELIFDSQLNLNFGEPHIMGHAYGDHPVIYRNREDHALHCRPMEWGCIPYYIQQEAAFAKQRSMMLNARSERILTDDKSYWYKIRNRRCLIPVSGFYEHREIKGWKNKVPYFIRLKAQPLFFIPGLYSVAELANPQTGELVKRWSYTMITRDANRVMRGIHNSGDNKHRMPLLLPFELSQAFLSDDLEIERYREILNFEMPPDLMDYHPVFSIRSPKLRPDERAKHMPWHWEQLPPLEV